MRPPPIFLLTVILASAVILTLFGVSALSPDTRKTNVNGPASVTATPLEEPTIGYGNPTRGDAQAKVTLVEFGDFQCAPCSQAENDVSRLLDEYDGQLRVVWKDLPNASIHPNAVDAASAARCADEQGGFWQFHDVLFANQASLLPQNFNAFAGAAGLDTTAFADCVANGRGRPYVERDFEEAQRLRVDATPYFFIGKTRLSGAVDYDQLRTAVEAELRRN